nr:EOG090X019S [Cyclestheria hislopi]
MNSNKEIHDRNQNRYFQSPSRIIPGEPSDSACLPISMKFCRHLQYNFTSYPNLLGHRGPRDADRLNEAARLLVDSECSPYIQHVLCHVLQPPCSESVKSDGNPSMWLPPCRNVCMAVSTACKAKIGLSQQNRRQDFVQNKLLSNDIVTGLRDLLRCDLFPIDNGMGSCTTKPVTNHIPEVEPSECVRALENNGHRNRICDGLMDCHDFSDEVACDYCPEGLVHCGVGAACIDVKQRCDGVPDCPNGSDERGCLTVAPDMDAAHFVHQYFQEGYVVFSEGNSTGKICVDSLNSSSLSPARQQSFLEMFGESACRSMSYRTMEHVTVRIDNERSVDYAHLTEPARWRATFVRAPCRSRQVLHLTCSELECGIRPVHVHPDRPGNHLTMLPASHGDWPWLAALIRDGVHACDGTLIADQWLLTSSYCFEGQGRAHWVARFATVRLSSDAPWEQERRVVGMVRSPVKGSSLALIKLESPVIFSDFVRPVCLTKESTSWKAMTSRCLFLAWRQGDVLREVTAKIQSNPICNNTATVCAELLSNKDYCQNDEFAGSPLLCQEKAGEAWSLVGVSSEHRHCDTPPTHQEVRLYDGIINNADWIVHTVRR